MSGDGEHKKLASSALFLIVGQFIVYAGNIIVSILLVRILSKSEYGTFMQVNLLCSTIVSLVVFGLPASLFYFIPKLQSEQVKRFILQNLVVLLLLGVISAGLVYVASDRVAGLMNNQVLADLSIYIAILLVLGILSEPIEPVLITLEKASWMAGLNVMFVFGSLLLFPYMILSGYGLEGLFLAMAGLQGFKLLAAYGNALNRTGSVRSLFRLDEFKEQFHYVAPIGVSRILSNLNVRIDQFIVSYLYAPSTYAVYARGAFQLPFIPMVSYNVSNVLLPTLVRLRNDNELEKMLALWHESIKKTLLILLPMGVFFFVFAKEVMTVLFTKEYLESAYVFMVYLCTVPFEATLYANIHQAFGRTRHILISNVINLSSTLALNFLLYQPFGILGPALATVLARLIMISYHFAVFRGYFGVSFRRVFPFTFQVRALALSALVGLAVFPFKYLAIPELLMLAMAGIAYAVLYVAVLWAFKLLTLEEKNQVMRWMMLKDLRQKGAC